MQQLVNTALGGLTLGMVYAAFALALVLIWRSTRVVNFAQAPMAMVTTFVALSVIEAGHSYWLGFAAALLSGLLLGAFLERVVVRPVEGKAEINAVILTLGLFIVLHALAALAGRWPRGGVRVLLTPDEEVGSPGSRPHIEAAARGARAVFVVEPPVADSHVLKIGRKGVGSFALTFRGVASHAGNKPEEGASAITEAVRRRASSPPGRSGATSGWSARRATSPKLSSAPRRARTCSAPPPADFTTFTVPLRIR